ncbi:MAG: hypothetical protein C5B54_00480 [Acidobacteria bacterium]|nr:MAG: hypothetical protein C5B54_00480 [Acidobacteriota bacterium]
MPFDVLPHHDIKLPPVQFYHPPWQLAQMALEARQRSYDAMLKSLDTVLNAADPLTRAKRQQAIAEAQFKMETLPLEKERLQFDVNYRRTHGGIGPPTTYSEATSRQKYEENEHNAARHDEAMNPGGQTTGKYSGSPPGSAQQWWQQQAQPSLKRLEKGGEQFEEWQPEVPGGLQFQQPTEPTTVAPNAQSTDKTVYNMQGQPITDAQGIPLPQAQQGPIGTTKAQEKEEDKAEGIYDEEGNVITS